MALRLLIVLVVLASSSLAQGFHDRELDGLHPLSETFPVLYDNSDLQDDKSTRADPIVCLQTLVSGLFVVRSAWYLRNDWIAIQQEREKGLAKCDTLPDPPAVEVCKTAVEKLAQEGKSRCYRTGLALSVGAVLLGINIRQKCFSSGEPDHYYYK